MSGPARKGEAARRYRRSQQKCRSAWGAVEPADVAHVDKTLGREIHGALTQGPRRLLRHISSAQTFTTGSGTVWDSHRPAIRQRLIGRRRVEVALSGYASVPAVLAFRRLFEE